jgi:transglutaminase-like putative cysteine protease
MGCSKGTNIMTLPSKIDPLVATKYINSDHPLVLDLAHQLTVHKNSDCEKGISIFSFVRNEIKFGFATGFWDNRASDVIRQRIGFCNTNLLCLQLCSER